MSKKMLLVPLALMASFTLVAASCSSDDDAASDDPTTTTMAENDDMDTTTTEAEMATADETVVDIAVSNPDFSTLVDLVTQAGLAETLSGEGPFTVFAPTNDAFAAVDPATVSALTADPTGALADVLKLHVISGEVMAADATAAVGTCVETLGGKVKVEQTGSDLTIGGAKIVDTDIVGSNGVIHVLDGVITAPSEGC